MEAQRTRLDEQMQMLGVITEISPSDEMLQADSRDAYDTYMHIGLKSVKHIKAALHLANRTEVASVLDFGCGHGRVLRFLKTAFPDARLVACDIDHEAVDFCASTFGAEPVYSHEDPREIALAGPFDVIWCGSVFSHLSERRWAAFLRRLALPLSSEGVLLFTTRGWPVVAELEARGEEPEMVAEVRATGFSYRDYPGQRYGDSLSSPAWVVKFLERFPALYLLMLNEGGLGQDVVACFRC
jgi:SAM-dependent methyltransferase